MKPNTVVRLNAGTYHVVSTYGAVNAVIRADIRVEAGKLTEATVNMRRLGSKDQQAMSLAEAVAALADEATPLDIRRAREAA